MGQCMTDEKETKLEIVKTPKAIQEIQNTINDVVPKVATMGQNMGKDIAKAFRKAYENMGYEFKEIEIPKNELQKESEQIHPIEHTPEYIIKLLDAGKIDEKKNCLCGLETLANYLQMELKIEVNTKLLKQFYNPDTEKPYSNKQIKQAVTAAKWGK